MDVRQPSEGSAVTREMQKRIPMERDISQGAARPNRVPGPLYTSPPQIKPQYCPCQLGNFPLCFSHRASSTTVDGGMRYTPETKFPTNQWPNEFATNYKYSACPSEGHTQEYRSAASNLENVEENVALAPLPPRSCSFDMSSNPFPDLGIAHLIPGCELQLPDLPSGYRNAPGALSDQIDIQPPILEENCQLMDPGHSESMFQLSADAGNPITESVDLLQRPTARKQFPHIGSGLKPHARPFGLGNEYVPHKLAHARRTDSSSLSDFDINGYYENLAHRPKDKALTEVVGTFLRPNPGHRGRRRSMPSNRSRKLSSVDQGISHTHSIQRGPDIPRVQVFDANMKVKFRKKRRFSEGEKERIARVRKIGACGDCRLKKRRVRNVHRRFSE